MTPYRLFFFTGNFHIDEAREFECEDDDIAVSISEQWRKGLRMELWQRDRRVKIWENDGDLDQA